MCKKIFVFSFFVLIYLKNCISQRYNFKYNYLCFSQSLSKIFVSSTYAELLIFLIIVRWQIAQLEVTIGNRGGKSSISFSGTLLKVTLDNLSSESRVAVTIRRSWSFSPWSNVNASLGARHHREAEREISRRVDKFLERSTKAYRRPLRRCFSKASFTTWQTFLRIIVNVSSRPLSSIPTPLNAVRTLV